MGSKPAVVFRADGNGQMGLGHIIRSTALAGMIGDSFETILATHCVIESVLNNAKQVFTRLVLLSAQEPEKEMEELAVQISKVDLVVLDGYHFDDRYQRLLLQNGLSFFAIDDIHAYPFLSNVIINHAGGISATDYKALPFTQFYLGPQYALLRSPFLNAAKNRRNNVTDRSCFICYGGADPNNRTLSTLESQVSTTMYFDQYHVVVGSAYHYHEELKRFASGSPNVFIYTNLSPDEMVTVMKKCSFAICSPSTIVYEYLSVGGIVFLDLIADNQKDVIRYFTAEGVAFPLQKVGSLMPDEIKQAFAKQAALFDGNSNIRFQKIFRQYFESKKLLILNVQNQDLMCCFEWANDPVVRGQSYNQSPITLEEHSRWFANKLKDANSYYYILELGGKPVAQIRFQVAESEAVLGYLVSERIRSQGLGTTILSKGIAQLLGDIKRPVRIVGHVKKDNIASQRSFEKLAFTKAESTVFPDSFTYTMIADGNLN